MTREKLTQTITAPPRPPNFEQLSIDPTVNINFILAVASHWE
jgi:hypothetical protein